MDPTPAPSKSIFRNPYLYSAIIFLGVAAYAVFLFIARYESNREYNRRNALKAAEQQRREDRAVIEQLGGTELAIRALCVSPKAIRRGESAQLCYDVTNAQTVSLDPPAGQVWPSHNRCIDLSPQKTTSYTLTIADASGKTASQSVELAVH